MPDDYVKDHVIIYTRILRSVLYQNVEVLLLKVKNKLDISKLGSTQQ